MVSKAISTMFWSLSDAERWKTLNIFFQPDLMFFACEVTICVMQRTTMSFITGDLEIHLIEAAASVHKGSPTSGYVPLLGTLNIFIKVHLPIPNTNKT